MPRPLFTPCISLLVGLICHCPARAAAPLAPIAETTLASGGRAWGPAREGKLALKLEAAAPLTRVSNLVLALRVPEARPDQKVRIRAGGSVGEFCLGWQGWRRVVVPVRALVRKGSPETIGELCQEITLEWIGEGPVELELEVGRAALVAGEPEGVAISDGELLALLDLARPELAAVRLAHERGDEAAALRELVLHFRRDHRTRMPHAEQTRDPRPAGDAARRGELSLIGIQHTYSDAEIDWRFNPTAGTAAFSKEWIWSLNRHDWWSALARAYEATGDDRYAEVWARQLRTWTSQHPTPAVPLEQEGAWRGLEAGLRLARVWPAAFFALAPSPAVRDEDVLLYLKTSVEHARMLAGHPYNPGNHYLLAMCGLLTQGVTMPEFTDAAFWRARALAGLGHSFERNTLSEGAWSELAPAYHQWVVNRALVAFRLAQTNGFASAVEPELWARLRKMAEWNVLLALPDGTVPRLNDGGPVRIGSEAALAAAVFPDSDLLSRAVSPEAPAPAVASLALPDSGYLVMRDGWAKDGSFVLLDTGPLGGWHGHQDALNLVAAFYGRLFLFDNGGYKYDTSGWRRYGIATASHNTILVDGLGQARGSETRPADVAFGSSQAVDFARGTYLSGYGADPKKPRPLAQHRREVAFLKPAAGRQALVVVVDSLRSASDQIRHYDLRWHIQGTRWRSEGNGSITRTDDLGRPNLALVSLAGATRFSGVSAQREPELLGWYYPDQNSQPEPALTIRHQGSASGVLRFVTLLVPSVGVSPSITVRPEGHDAWLIDFSDRPSERIRLERQPAADRPSFSLEGVEWPALR